MSGEQETLYSDRTILPYCSVLLGLSIGKTQLPAREQGSLFGVGHPGQPPRTWQAWRRVLGLIWRASRDIQDTTCLVKSLVHNFLVPNFPFQSYFIPC